MPDEGYMDAAGIDTPDAGDDALRRTLADAVEAHTERCSCCPTIKAGETSGLLDAQLPAVREHVAAAVQAERERVKAEVAGEFEYLWTDYPKAMDRAEKAEAAIGRAMQVYRQHTSGASAWCKCIACDMARALAYDGTGAEHG